MRPTEILTQEHRVIEQVLNCLEQLADRCQRDGTFNTLDAEQAIDFFRHFADQCHHGKEEIHLFPAMEAKGFPRHGGPTGVMLDEHEEGRRLVRSMAESISAAPDSEAVRTRFVDSARTFIGLLRDHIQKEDHCLFTMADQALTDAEQEELLKAFTKVETEQMGTGTHEKYVRLANELADRYGVARAVTDTGGGCGCAH